MKNRFQTSYIALALTLILLQGTRALDIQVLPGSGDSAPDDPGNVKMLFLMNAAADYWEDIIEDSGTLTITCFYENGIGGNARADATATSGGRVTHATIMFEVNPSYGGSAVTDWYYDDDPSDHSEFDMQPILFRDIPTDRRASVMTGATPDVLEVSYRGGLSAGSPATGGADFYTYALHEMGHTLGMISDLPEAVAELADEDSIQDYDFNPAQINGAVTGMRNDTAGGLHASRGTVVGGVPTIFPLMNTSIGPENRRLPSAADVLAIATCPNPGWTSIDLPRKDFLPGGSTDWNTAGNWIGNRLPDSADDVFVRFHNTGGLFGVLPFPVDLSDIGRAENLTVSDYSILSTGNELLLVDSLTTVVHDGDVLDSPTIKIDPNGELDTRDLTLAGGNLVLDGGLADIGHDLRIEVLGSRFALLRGHGTIDIANGGKLINDSKILAENSNTLVLRSAAANPWDLDGGSENGEVAALDGNINVASGGLADAFSGTMKVGGGHSISMAENWSIDGPSAELELAGGSGFATIGGAGDLDFVRGAIEVSGEGHMLNHVTFRADAAIDAQAGALLSLIGGSSFKGGSYTGAGTLRFADTVDIDRPTTFATGAVDLDGLSGTTVVNVDLPLTLNVGQLDSADSRFDGTLNLSGGLAAIEVNGPASWEMAGQMNVNGSTFFSTTMVRGAPVEISGSVDINIRSIWGATTTISGAIVMGSDANDRLVLTGGTEATPNRLDSGQIGLFGTLELSSGAWLGGAGSIFSATDIKGSSGLLADGGTLFLARAPGLDPNSTIGTASLDAVLDVNPAWVMPGGSTLRLDGGQVIGGAITNQSLITGHGMIAADGLINPGEIRADGGTLTIDTPSTPDLDGSSVPYGKLAASGGDLMVEDNVSDFRGEIEISAGRTLTFGSDFELGNLGDLTLQGSASEAAKLAGPEIVLNGELELSGLCEMDARRFKSSVEVQLAADTTLTITSPTTIDALATFGGDSTASIVFADELLLADFADLGIGSTVANDVEFGTGSTTATATLLNPDFQNSTRLNIDLANTTSDRLVVSGALHLDGMLRLEFNAPSASPGDLWKIIEGGAISGRFDSITTTGLAGDSTLQVYVLADAVYVKLVREQTFAEWALSQGLPLGMDGVADDADDDGFSNGLEALAGTDPNKPGERPLLTAKFLELGGTEYPSLVLERNSHTAITNLSLGFARSEDLISWSDNNTGMESTVFDPLNCTETLVFFSKIPVADSRQQFLRLETSP